MAIARTTTKDAVDRRSPSIFTTTSQFVGRLNEIELISRKALQCAKYIDFRFNKHSAIVYVSHSVAQQTRRRRRYLRYKKGKLTAFALLRSPIGRLGAIVVADTKLTHCLSL